MLEAKYYRDYGHNYMILHCTQDQAADSYQHRVLTSGKIREILPCSVRHINGDTYYYYDISSRTSLDSMFRGKKMSRAQVAELLRQLHGIYEKLSGYFMEESGLVLSPEHIYYDIAARRYVGLYYPDYRAEASEDGRALADFLLEHTDTEDRDLAEKMCRICELAEENCFFAEDALRILEEGEEPAAELPQAAEPQDGRERYVPAMEDYDFEEHLPDPAENKKGAGKGKLFYSVFAVLSVCGIAGAVAVYSACELTRKEEVVLYAVTAVMGVCLFLCVAGIFAVRKKRSASGAGGGATENVCDPEQERNLYGEFQDRKPAADMDMAAIYPLDGVISRDMDLEMTACDPAVRRQTQRSAKTAAAKAYCAQEPDDCGDTVFFDGSADREFKLYALDRKNKNHIELKRFPYTIGKMAGCVDHVIADDSVSRIHARFDMQGERVLLTDMNSTNGTYKNGLRMQPRETVEIEPGDEIRFGGINYCYR